MTDAFTLLIKSQFGLTCIKEYKFYPTRKWRFDYSIVELKIAIEVEGGVYTQGRHTRGKGFVNDMEKYNNAACEGWLLIRVVPSKLMSADTLDFVRRAIKQRNLD